MKTRARKIDFYFIWNLIFISFLVAVILYFIFFWLKSACIIYRYSYWSGSFVCQLLNSVVGMWYKTLDDISVFAVELSMVQQP